MWQWSDDPFTPPNCWSGDSDDYGDSADFGGAFASGEEYYDGKDEEGSDNGNDQSTSADGAATCTENCRMDYDYSGATVLGEFQRSYNGGPSCSDPLQSICVPCIWGNCRVQPEITMEAKALSNPGNCSNLCLEEPACNFAFFWRDQGKCYLLKEAYGFSKTWIGVTHQASRPPCGRLLRLNYVAV